jgi:hypothetical protein
MCKLGGVKGIKLLDNRYSLPDLFSRIGIMYALRRHCTLHSNKSGSVLSTCLKQIFEPHGHCSAADIAYAPSVEVHCKSHQACHPIAPWIDKYTQVHPTIAAICLGCSYDQILCVPQYRHVQ